MEIVTGSTGQAHVTPIDDAVANSNIGYLHDRVVFSVYDNFAAQDISASEIRVSSGYGIMQGRLFKIPANTYDTLRIDNGSAGVKRMDLIVARYTVDSQTSHEDISLAVIKGTSGTDYTEPSHEESDINNGGTIDEFVLYKIYIDGIAIDHIDAAFELMPDGGRVGYIERVVQQLPQDVQDLAGKTWVNSQIAQLQTNFQNGVDTITGAVNTALTAQDEAPLSASTPTAVAAGVKALTEIEFDVSCYSHGEGTTKISLYTDAQGAKTVEFSAFIDCPDSYQPTPATATYYEKDENGDPAPMEIPIDQIQRVDANTPQTGFSRYLYRSVAVSVENLADWEISLTCEPSSSQKTHLHINKHCVTRKTWFRD